MKKRHLQNCLSKEKKIYEANVKKYKRLIESEGSVKSKNRIKLQSVVPIICKHVTSETEFVEIVRVDTDPALKSSPIVEYDSNSEENKSKCEEIQSYTFHSDVNEPLTSSLPKNNTENEDVLDILKNILQSQKNINTRLEKLEQNQENVLKNQSILSNGQSLIGDNQEQIASMLEQIKTNIASKLEMITQSKMLMECKVAIRKIEDSVCRMTGERNDKIDEIDSMIPLNTLAAVQEVEQKLDSPAFAQATTTYLHKLKGPSEDVSSVIPAIFTDELLEKYNWEGRWGKQALRELILFDKTLRDVFQQQGAFEFEKSVRKAVERSHHRIKQKNYMKRSNK